MVGLKLTGDTEYGTCEVCGKENHLVRTYWHYDIKCECHYPIHFEMKLHCYGCVPKEPITTKMTVKTDSLKYGNR